MCDELSAWPRPVGPRSAVRLPPVRDDVLEGFHLPVGAMAMEGHAGAQLPAVEWARPLDVALQRRLDTALWTPNRHRHQASAACLETSDKSVGVHMFVEEKDPVAKIRHLTCHELIHAASAHLLLPAWLNEGLAAASVDRFMGEPTIRQDFLGLLQRTQPKGAPPSYRAMSRLQGETLAYHAVRGYWIVRLLEETSSGLLRELLSVRRTAKELERRVALALHVAPERFWTEIDELLVGHFTPAGHTAA